MKIEAGTVRCAPHSDYGTLTLLFQDTIGGLEVLPMKLLRTILEVTGYYIVFDFFVYCNFTIVQVKNAKDVWVKATPIPGTILVNTGDLLYFWSGGRYPATVGREIFNF